MMEKTLIVVVVWVLFTAVFNSNSNYFYALLKGSINIVLLFVWTQIEKKTWTTGAGKQCFSKVAAKWLIGFEPVHLSTLYQNLGEIHQAILKIDCPQTFRKNVLGGKYWSAWKSLSLQNPQIFYCMRPESFYPKRNNIM